MASDKKKKAPEGEKANPHLTLARSKRDRISAAKNLAELKDAILDTLL